MAVPAVRRKFIYFHIFVMVADGCEKNAENEKIISKNLIIKRWVNHQYLCNSLSEYDRDIIGIKKWDIGMSRKWQMCRIKC